MTPPLSNKALAVLGVLRERDEMTVHDVYNEVRRRTPCGHCQGTGDVGERWGCSRCYGHGHVPFGYSEAYVALKQLLARGLVDRRHPRDEFGDELRTWRWFVVTAEAEASDPLEALYLAPSAEVDR